MTFTKSPHSKSLMVGKAKDYFETIETKTDTFDTLVGECKEYAIRRKLEASTKKDSTMELWGIEY